MAALTSKKLISVVLAGILLAASIAPPGIRHTHSVAESDGIHHQHKDGQQFAGHGHSHHNDEQRRVSAWQETGTQISGSPTRHLHFYFLGLELTLPDSTPEEGDDNSLRKTEVLAVAQGHKLQLFQTTSSDPTLPNPVLSTHSTAPSSAPMQTIVLRTPPVSSAPLCDTARFERSGVLLA